MSTLDKIKEACSAKGFDFEETNSTIGICFGRYVYYWFNHLHGEVFVFEQCYSQNSGRIRKGLSTRFKAYRLVSKKLDINI